MIYHLVGLGGIILAIATMDESRAEVCNKRLSGRNLAWIAL